MKKLYKIVAVILSVSICTTMITFSIAAEVNEKSNVIDIKQDVYVDGKTFTKTDQFEDIYENNGQYIMQFQVPAKSGNLNSMESVVIPVKKTVVDFSNAAAVNDFLHRDDLPREAIDSFYKKYKCYTELSEDDENYHPGLVLFEPDTEDTQGLLGEPVASMTASSTTTTTDYIYNGWKMRTYQISYVGLSMGWKNVCRGRTTKDKVRLIKNITIVTASVANKYVSYLTSGISILQEYLNYAGLTEVNLSTNVTDYFQTRLEWDQTEKYTMRDFGGATSWQTGLVTYKVKVNKLGSEVYFANTGKGARTTLREDINTTVQSQHFANPWATAYANGTNTTYEFINWTSGGVVYNFG